MRRNTLVATLAFSLAGCGADPGTAAPTGADEEALRSTAWSTLAGSYTLAAGQTGPFAAVVFERTADHTGHHYFTESFASLIHCGVGTGCTTTHERSEGWYTATAHGVTLHPDTGTAESFTYTLRGTTLSLTAHGTTSHLSSEPSYCDTSADCAEEGLVHPECAIGPGGGWQCSTTHTCSYRCGGAGASAGQPCGGIAGIQCQTGLECVFSAGSPVPDAEGTCRVVSGVGGPCGGFTSSPDVCAMGLHCVVNRIPDIPGTCQR